MAELVRHCQPNDGTSLDDGYFVQAHSAQSVKESGASGAVNQWGQDTAAIQQLFYHANVSGKSPPVRSRTS